jgi:uncharacterized protein YwqG
LAAAARHAIILEPGPVEEGADGPIGASRLGGMPDLPSEVPWPWRPAFSDSVFKEHAEHPWPLSFVAQIDFAEIHAVGGLEGFPSSGRLLFFCEPIEVPWGQLMEDQTCASVMFFPEQMDRLGRRDFPVELSNPRSRLLRPEEFVARPRRLTPKPWLLPPPLGSRELRTLDPDWNDSYPVCWKRQEKAYHAYRRFWEDLAVVHPNALRAIRQVGGIAFPDQDPVEADCVKFGDDDYLNRPPDEEKAFLERRLKEGAPIDWPDYKEWSQAYDAFKARERVMYFERANSWQLVLQIDSDEEMQWYDDGRIYVCIRKRDLAERRFDRCWTLMQCT